ncbi:MAG: fibronectin type III domain-containing protein [Oscillospiraceae bacterium]|nr:fibronectin type III domain-containing protein [Oscillospiraceae bacterium]
MKYRKTAALLSFALAFGTFAVLPESISESLDIGITAEAASDDHYFIGDYFIKKESDGIDYIVYYSGPGGDITLPEGVAVGSYAFSDNDTITSITIPKGFPQNASIGEYAFSKCINLKKLVIESPISIGEGSFYNCINLRTVELKGGVSDRIGREAFFTCYNLKKVSIGENKNDSFYIDNAAFYDCFALSSVNIPESCSEIKGTAFMNCCGLTEVRIPEKTIFTPDGVYHMGYIHGAESYFLARSDWKKNQVTKLADGNTTLYEMKAKPKEDRSLRKNFVAVTAQKITLIVTKGSDAERYAKENGIAYKYDDSSSVKLAAPSDFKVSKTNNSITLSWSKVEGADAYTIYLLNEETGKFEKYKTVKSEKCTVSGLKNDTSYKFKVTALVKENNTYQKGGTSYVK